MTESSVYDRQRLKVDDIHEISIEQSGNPNGIPVLYLHGGPGAGLGKNYQWPFSPSKYRIIGFDQRGCGQSTPSGELQNNTTYFLLQDIETIRKHLNVDNWIVFGGSWGSTLALLYAIKHAQCVTGLVLRGIFLARKQDYEWFLSANGGASQVYPDAYEAFSQGIRAANDYIEVCKQFIARFSDDTLAKRALQDWYNWEGYISRLTPAQVNASDMSTDKQVVNLALLECHYVLNQCFIDENHIINHAQAISHIPCHIVHGRYDMVCKSQGAYELHQAMPHSHLNIIDNAGHSMSESGIAARLVDIMQNQF